MTAAQPTPLRRGKCSHAAVDTEQLLADDRLAAALAAPVIPGTSAPDAQLHLIRLYRRIKGGDATADAACALLHRYRGASDDHNVCVLAKVAWRRSEEHDPLTDTGNGRRLAVVCGADIAHDPAVGWRIWTGSAWQPDPDGTVVQRWAKIVPTLIAAEADSLYRRARVAADSGDEGAEETGQRVARQAGQAAAWGIKSQSAGRIAAMVTLVRDEPGVLTRAEAWDTDVRLLACPGATVELHDRGHTVRRPRRADRLTRVTRGTPGTAAAVPLWRAFLERALPDPQVRAYVQRLAGYCLLAANPERLLVILIGPTSTGKTTLAEVIAHVLGEHGGSFDLTLFRSRAEEGPRPDLLTALGHRFIATSEASDRWRLHVEAIKRLTGGDSMRARTLHSRTFVEARPAFTPWIATNAAPSIDGADQALWRRLAVVPFTVGIDPAEQDAGLGERIRRTEADGVLDWLLTGWDDYCAHGLADVPASCAEAALELRSDLSHVDHWLREQTEHDAAYCAPLDELWRAWRTWCVDSGVPDVDRGTRRGFGRWLTDRGFGTGHAGARDDRHRVRTGLRLTDAGARETLTERPERS